MRGLALGIVVVAALDLLLTSPTARVTGALTAPARWLRDWMDPTKPLIGTGHLHTAASGSSGSSLALTPFNLLGPVLSAPGSGGIPPLPPARPPHKKKG